MSASSLNSSDLHSPDFFPFKGNSSVNEVSDCLIKKINETVRYNFILRGYLIDDLSSFNKEKLITWISSPARRFQNLAANPRDHFAIPETVDRLFESLKGSIQQGGASVSNQEKYYEDCASLVREKSASITPYAEDYDWMSLKISPSKDFKEAISMLFSQLEVQVLNDNTIEQKMKQIFRAMEEIGTIEMICNNLVSNFGLNREQAMQIAYRLQKGNPFHLSLVDMLLNNPSDLKDRNLCFLEQGTIHTFKVEEIHSEKPSHAISIFTLVGKKQKAIITVNDFSKLLTHIFWETEKAGNLRSFSVELTAHQQNEIYITQTEPFTNELFIEKLKQRSVAEKAIIDHLKTVDLKPILNCLIANWSHHEDLLLEGGEILALLRDVFRSRELEDRVLTICQIDEISLQSLEESNLLLDYVFRANLEQMAPNLNLSEGSDLIKMLGTSLETSKDLEGKRGVAILGETGSGKSTTTCFLVGAKMEEYLNRFGKTCVRVAESLEDNLLPEVGFSLGISKTTFAQGFHLASLEEDGQRIGRRVHSNSKVDFPQHIRQDQFSIVDFPGFYDTRGTEYEVVTSFSIDHGILSLQALDAAIQVLPYDLLTSRRSAFFINALRELSARFGGAFRDPTLSGRIFFLITKQDPGVGVSQLRERALELVHEDRNSASPDPEKCALLTFFANQCQNGRVFTILPILRQQRIEILNKVLESSQKPQEASGLKERYQLSLESPEMKMKFADVLNKSIGVWENTALPQFLKHSKKRIEETETNINEIKAKREQLEKEIERLGQKITALDQENAECLRIIEKLRQSLISPDYFPGEEFLMEINSNEREYFVRLERDIDDLREDERRLSRESEELRDRLRSKIRVTIQVPPAARPE